MTIPVGVAHQALQSLMKVAALKLPSRLSFVVSRNLNRLQSNADVRAYDAARVEIGKKHADDPNATGQLTFEHDLAGFLAELNPIASEEIEVEVLRLPLALLDAVDDAVAKLPTDKQESMALTTEDYRPLDSFWEE